MAIKHLMQKTEKSDAAYNLFGKHHELPLLKFTSKS